MKTRFYLTIMIGFFFLSIPSRAQQPDQSPVYPDCEQSAEQMKCMHDKLLGFIESHFDSNVLNKIKNEKEVNIHIAFVIGESGKIEEINIRSAYPDIVKEMTRTLKDLPRIIPAKSEGHVIRMRYELPITFQINQKE